MERRRKTMSKNWREERRNERLVDLENEVKRMRKEVYEDEKLVRMIESPLIKVTSGGRTNVCFGGREIESRGLCLETSDDTLLVEVGTNGSMGDDGFTAISIKSLLDDGKSNFSFVLGKGDGRAGLIFKGKNSLLHVTAVLKAIGTIFSEELYGSLKDSIAEVAKEDAESRNGKKSKNGGKR